MFIDKIDPNEIFAGCIAKYSDVYPSPQETIKEVESECADIDSGFGWLKAATEGEGQLQNQRTNFNLGISYHAKITGNKTLKAVHNQFYFILSSALMSYKEIFSIGGDLFHEEYNILKYSGGQHYDAHSDANGTSPRSVSAILYLNDDYSGGEIEFVNFATKIKPAAGDLYIFPSNYAYSHIAHPVTSGTKYAIVTWIHEV